MAEPFVTLGTYPTSFEANLVKGKLESFGIAVVLGDDHIVDIDPLLTNLLGGVKVRVTESQLAEARQLLMATVES